MRHERDDAAFVVKLMGLPIPLVVQRDQDAGVQECQLAQPLREGIEAEICGLENVGIGAERDFRAALFRRARHLELAGGLAALVFLFVHLAVAPDFQIELLRQRIHH